MNYCALYLGVLEHTPRMFVYCSIWCVLEYIFREHSLKKYIYIDIGARIGGGGGRVSFRPSTPTPPLEKNNLLSGGLFLLLVLHVGVFLQRFISLWGGIHVDFFVLTGIIFLACHPPPPPYKHFCGRPILEYRYGIVTH